MARVTRVTLNTVVIPLPATSLPPNPPTLSQATRVFTEDCYLNTIDTILDQGNIAIPDIASFDDRGGNYSGACDGVVVAEVTNKAFNRINFTLETPADTACSSSSSSSSPPPPPFPSDTLQSPVPSDLLSAPAFDFDWSSCLDGEADNFTDVSAYPSATIPVTIDGSNNPVAKEEVKDIVDDLNVLGVELDSLMFVSEKLHDHPTSTIGPALPTKLSPTSSRLRSQTSRQHHHPLVGTIT